MSQFNPVNVPGKVEHETKVKEEPTDEPLPNIDDVLEHDAPVKQEVTIKQEDTATDNGITDEANHKETSPKAPVSPHKRGHADNATSDDVEKGGSPTKKKRASPKKPVGKVTSRPLPTSYENASPEDKMLLRMKDEENKSWADIRKAWMDMTGDEVGNSTLSGRYARIKANLITFPEEDKNRLVQFLKEIEEKFELEKWHRVAEAIANDGGAKYPPTTLQKKHKEIAKKSNNIAIGGDSK